MQGNDSKDLNDILTTYSATLRVSKLEPHKNLILFLYYNEYSIRKIIEILSENYEVSVSYTAVREFIIRRLKTVDSSKHNSPTASTISSKQNPVENKLPSKVEGKGESRTNQSSLHPMFEAAFNSRPDSGFVHDPLKLSREKKGKLKK